MRSRKNNRANKNRTIPTRFTAHVVVLSQGERWCVNCGETMLLGDACPRCECRIWADPKAVLRPDEYVVM